MRRALALVFVVAGCDDAVTLAAADAAMEDAPVADASARDAGADAAPDATTCEPPDIASFVPPAYVPPTAAYQGLCTPQQIDAYFAACLSLSHTQASCDAISGSNASAIDRACAACILTKSTDVAYGPIITHAGVVSINVAGCMALVDANGGASCARAYQVETACEDFMCGHPCPVDMCNFMCYPQCVQSVRRNECTRYANAAACADVEADAGAPFCFGPMTFEEYYARIVPLFCGTRASDASTE